MKRMNQLGWLLAAAAVMAVPLMLVSGQGQPPQGGQPGGGGPGGGGPAMQGPMNAPNAMTVRGAIESFNLTNRGDVEGFILLSEGRIGQINYTPEIRELIGKAIAVGDTVEVMIVPEAQGAGGAGRGPGQAGAGPGAPANMGGGMPGMQGMGGQAQGMGGQGPAMGGMGVQGMQGMPASDQPDHPVYRLISLKDSKGKEFLARPEDRQTVHVEGTVKAINYDRRGVTNGAQLSTGDLVHVPPAALQAITLTTGQKLSIDGMAQPLPGGGQFIEALTINGINLRPQPGQGRAGGPGGGAGPGGFQGGFGNGGGPGAVPTGGPGGPGEPGGFQPRPGTGGGVGGG